MRTADELLTAACNFAAERPWCLCLIIVTAILIGSAIPGQVML